MEKENGSLGTNCRRMGWDTFEVGAYMIGTLFALPSCLPYIHVCPKCPFLWFALHGHFFMVCPTSCLPYIDCCPTCQFLWSQNVSFVTSGLPYFMFALSKMSLPYACLPYRKCCPTWQFFFHPNETFVTSGSPYFMFALSEMSLPYTCLPYRKCCPTKCIFFNEFLKFL